MIYLGDTQLNTFPLGDTQPLSAYLGDTLVWPDGTPPSPYAGQYLTFIAQEAGTFKFSGSTTANTLQYSLDSGTTWTTLPHNTNSPTVQSGSSIIWKGSNLRINSGIGNFRSSGKFEAQGNIMSLIYGDSFTGQTSLSGKPSVFQALFAECSGITSAENLILPATTLGEHCYVYMFAICENLTKAPELPAQILKAGCYLQMFYVCTSLNYIKCLATDISATNCTWAWVQEVASSGTFVKASSATWPTGSSGIPNNWTVQNA